MPRGLRVELQAEIPGRRMALFPLVASADGLARWTGGAEMTPDPGAPVRIRLREAVGIGHVLAIDAPQHVSWTWDWENAPLGTPTVLAFDLIDHADWTHITLRHVGFRSRSQLQLHDAIWRYWFARLEQVASTDAAGPAASTAAPA